jgi:hypothetical protein
VPNTKHCVQKSNLNATQIIINGFDDSKYDSHEKTQIQKKKKTMTPKIMWKFFLYKIYKKLPNF